MFAVRHKLRSIPLSNDTVNCRITSISASLEYNLLSRLLQTDVSTEGQAAHLLAYMRHVWREDIIEDFLFCLPLPEHEKAFDMFTVFNRYFDENKISLNKLVGFCTDGAPSMSGRRAGLRALIAEKAPDCIWSHCMLHREQLATKDLCPELNGVLETAVRIVNINVNHCQLE